MHGFSWFSPLQLCTISSLSGGDLRASVFAYDLRSGCTNDAPYWMRFWGYAPVIQCACFVIRHQLSLLLRHDRIFLLQAQANAFQRVEDILKNTNTRGSLQNQRTFNCEITWNNISEHLWTRWHLYSLLSVGFQHCTVSGLLWNKTSDLFQQSFVYPLNIWTSDHQHSKVTGQHRVGLLDWHPIQSYRFRIFLQNTIIYIYTIYSR